MSFDFNKTKSILSPHRVRLKDVDETNPSEHELSSSVASEESHALLSETVTTLASTVYNELERIIRNFGQESVKDLMPVMISILESLDSALNDREELKIEVESLKEQNDQIFQQYEKEKSFHKDFQQRYSQVEDHLEEMKRENDEKLQSLESIVKIFEIKARNATDHIARLEDKENEMKQEYKRLHERYCELFKAHCDYMERTKILYGSDRLESNGAGSTNLSGSRTNSQNQFVSQTFADRKTNSSNENLDEQISNDHSDLNLTNFKATNVEKNLRSELGEISGNETQTEAIVKSNDVAVNTGMLSNMRNCNRLSETFDDEQFFNNDVDFDQSSNPTGAAISDDDDDDESKNNDPFLHETQLANIDIAGIDGSNDLFAMTKEVANLIKENSELFATKNALNVLKDDLLAKIEEYSNQQEILREEVNSLQTVRTRLQSRIAELEDELKKSREETERKKKDEEDDVSSSDRKRFTRVEMQRVLFERNQYKQRLFELEEAIHRHDALRASKHEQMQTSTSLNTISASSSNENQKKGTKVWRIFSGLFGSASKETPAKRPANTVVTTNLSSTVKRSSTNDQIAKNESLVEETLSIDRSISSNAILTDATKQSANRRINSILINDDARLQAYGWSLSSKNQLKLSEVNGKVQVNVPVPVYCRPIFNTNDTTQIWCAIGIDLTGSPSPLDHTVTNNETSVDQLNQQLIESFHQMVDEQCLKLSSLVWIAAKSNEKAMITIIDSNKAEKIIDTFTLGSAVVYAMGSVPGPSKSDYAPIDDSKWTLFEADTASASDVKVTPCSVASLSMGFTPPGPANAPSNDQIQRTTQTTNEQETTKHVSTKYPTVWLGSGDGWLYIHSAIGEHRKTIDKVWLRHAIYSIVHVHGRVFVSLANEKIVVFHRRSDGTWDLDNLHLIITGKSRESVRCMINVGESIWCGVANRIYVIDARTLEVRKHFDVHLRPEHSVQHMTWSSDGVWLSVRLSSTLQLYHAQTYQHLQDVDVQPYVEKMIATEKAGLYFVHISALTIACRRLWIGTGNGIIISVPLTENSPNSSVSSSSKPGSVVRVYDQSSSNFVPYCSMNNAQLSFHGYRDAVKFFVAVPGQPPTKTINEDESNGSNNSNSTHIESGSSSFAFGDILVVSGGDGYIDFRIGDGTGEKNDELNTNNRNISYLIVWHLGSI